MKNLWVGIFGLWLMACSQKTKADLSGKWMMHQVIQKGEDVSEAHNPNQDRYLILKPDSSFESGGTPFGVNTGKYHYNAAEQSLFLDSDIGPEDDSYWKVSFSGDTMYWIGFGSAWAEDFEIIQIRSQ